MPNIYFDNYNEDQVEHIGDQEDYPDPPRDPRYDPENPRQLEVALNRYRIRFNWREPDEDKQTAIAQEHEGLAPGQSKHVRYKIEVQKKPTNSSWQTIETEFVRHTFYTYHSTAGESDLIASYRARIWSVDEEDQLSLKWLNSNDGKLYTTYTGGGSQLLGGGEKQTISFSYPGEIPVPKVFETGWTSDGNYRIVKVSARVGIHDGTHPNDGCVRGGPIYINIRKYDENEDTFTKVFTTGVNGTDDSRLSIGAGKHKDIAWQNQIDRPNLFDNQVLAVSIVKDPSNTYTGRGLVVNIVLEPK